VLGISPGEREMGLRKGKDCSCHKITVLKFGPRRGQKARFTVPVAIKRAGAEACHGGP